MMVFIVSRRSMLSLLAVSAAMSIVGAWPLAAQAPELLPPPAEEPEPKKKPSGGAEAQPEQPTAATGEKSAGETPAQVETKIQDETKVEPERDKSRADKRQEKREGMVGERQEREKVVRERRSGEPAVRRKADRGTQSDRNAVDRNIRQ